MAESSVVLAPKNAIAPLFVWFAAATEYALDVADKRFGRRWNGVRFLSHLRSLRATMSQKSSVPQAISFVSRVLKLQCTPSSP
jgi:hypothetical protein